MDDLTAVERARLSLTGLAIGDAFGEMFSYRPASARHCIETGMLPPKPWWHTDDTEMALAIVETLMRFSHIEQDWLAQRFAERFRMDPGRGYGKMARMILRGILGGEDWRALSQAAFSGTGSMGNGSAMRISPLGAYFAEDLDTAAGEAKASALVTHAHPEGPAGAVAVAIAAATAWNLRAGPKAEAQAEIYRRVLQYTPPGETREGIVRASRMPYSTPVAEAAKTLGNGCLVTCPDTVPYVVWCATRHLDDYRDALIETVAGGGDCDTNCAMVGGIVVLFAGLDKIPAVWRASQEPFELQA